MTPPIRPATPRDVAKLFTLGAVWGSAFLCIEIALTGFAALSLTAARILVAGLFMLLLARLAGLRLPRQPAVWGRMALVGLCNAAVPFLLIAWGQQYVSAGMAAILLGSAPFASLLLNHVLTRDDRLTVAKVLGVGLGFLGLLVLVGVEGLGGARSTLWGQLAVIGAGVSYALSGWLTRALGALDSRVSASGVLLSTAVYMVPAALLLDRPWRQAPPLDSLAALLFLGLVSSGLAYLLRFQLIRDTGAVFMSQVNYLVPVFGVFWAWLFLRETPPGAAWIALALTLGGIAVSRLPPRPRG